MDGPDLAEHPPSASKTIREENARRIINPHVNSLWQNPHGVRPAIHPGQTTGGGTHAAQFSRWGLGRRSIPADRVAARRSSLRFGRNTPGIPPSRALSAGRLTGLGAHTGSTTGCSPRRCAPLIVAFRSKYTRYSSLTRLVSRAPHRPRRSHGFHHRLFTASLRAAHRCVSVAVFLPHAPCQPGASPASALNGFHHRLFTASLRAARRCVSVEIHPVFLPHAPCQPGASPGSALTWVSPQAVTACRAGNARERRPRRSAGMERRSSGPHRENWPAPRPKAAKRVQLPSVKRASQNKAPPLQRGIPIRRLRQSVESSGSSVEFHPPQRGVPANRPPQAPDISSVSCFCKLRSFTHAPQGPFPPQNTPN